MIGSHAQSKELMQIMQQNSLANHILHVWLIKGEAGIVLIYDKCVRGKKEF